MTVSQTSKEDQIPLQRCPQLSLITSTAKGRGVFASQHIPARTIIETCPVVILDPTETREHIEKTTLNHYTYSWPTVNSTGKHSKTQAVVFGLGSMFNHSTQNQNVGWQRDLENELVIYRALHDIQQGEELCISYGHHLTFEDVDKANTDGDVETDANALERIELDSLK